MLILNLLSIDFSVDSGLGGGGGRKQWMYHMKQLVLHQCFDFPFDFTYIPIWFIVDENDDATETTKEDRETS